MVKRRYRVFASITITLGFVFAALSVLAQAQPKNSKLTESDRAAWRKILNWPSECEEAFQELYKDDKHAGLELYEITPKQYLVEVTCYRGAYQPGQVFMLFDEARGISKLLEFKTYSRETDGRVKAYVESEIAGFTKFNTKTKELEIFSKSRGPGDCGYLATYKFINGKPVVKEARAQACYSDADFDRAHDPRRWPKVAKP